MNQLTNLLHLLEVFLKLESETSIQISDKVKIAKETLGIIPDPMLCPHSLETRAIVKSYIENYITKQEEKPIDNSNRASASRGTSDSQTLLPKGRKAPQASGA